MSLTALVFLRHGGGGVGVRIEGGVPTAKHLIKPRKDIINKAKHMFLSDVVQINIGSL